MEYRRRLLEILLALLSIVLTVVQCAPGSNNGVLADSGNGQYMVRDNDDRDNDCDDDDDDEDNCKEECADLADFCGRRFWSLVGVIIGVVILAFAIIIVTIIICRRKKKRNGNKFHWTRRSTQAASINIGSRPQPPEVVITASSSPPRSQLPSVTDDYNNSNHSNSRSHNSSNVHSNHNNHNNSSHQVSERSFVPMHSRKTEANSPSAPYSNEFPIYEDVEPRMIRADEPPPPYEFPGTTRPGNGNLAPITESSEPVPEKKKF